MRLSTTGSHSKAAIEPGPGDGVAHRDADRDERHDEDDDDEGPRGPHEGGSLGGGAAAAVEEGVDDLAELLGGGTQPGVARQVGVDALAEVADDGAHLGAVEPLVAREPRLRHGPSVAARAGVPAGRRRTARTCVVGCAATRR